MTRTGVVHLIENVLYCRRKHPWASTTWRVSCVFRDLTPAELWGIVFWHFSYISILRREDVEIQRKSEGIFLRLWPNTKTACGVPVSKSNLSVYFFLSDIV